MKKHHIDILIHYSRAPHAHSHNSGLLRHPASLPPNYSVFLTNSCTITNDRPPDSRTLPAPCTLAPPMAAFFQSAPMSNTHFASTGLPALPSVLLFPMHRRRCQRQRLRPHQQWVGLRIKVAQINMRRFQRTSGEVDIVAPPSIVLYYNVYGFRAGEA